MAPCPTAQLGGSLCSQPANAGCFDFEVDSLHTIDIEATDGVFQDQFTLTVQVLDENECSPVVAGSSLSCSVNENAGPGQVIRPHDFLEMCDAGVHHFRLRESLFWHSLGTCCTKQAQSQSYK